MPTDSFFEGPNAAFPPTRRSVIASLGSDDAALRARGFEVLARAYWKPVYKHVRVRWRKPPEEARDLTQEFFARALEKRYFRGYDATKALFRTYLKGSLDRFVMDVGRGERRIKRGGASTRLSLDFDLAEVELEQLGVPSDVEACFDAEWTRHLLSTAVQSLEALCRASDKAIYFEVFRRYVLDEVESATASGASVSQRPSYGALAADLAISVSDVTNYLSWTRREFRRLVLEALREITSSEEEFRSEARGVLGVEP